MNSLPNKLVLFCFSTVAFQGFELWFGHIGVVTYSYVIYINAYCRKPIENYVFASRNRISNFIHMGTPPINPNNRDSTVDV